MAFPRLLLLLTSLALYQIGLADFSNPPSSNAQISDPVYTVGQKLNIQWSTDIDSVDILIWASPTQGQNYSIILLQSSASTFPWTVSPTNLNGTKFILALYNHSSINNWAFASHEFEIKSASSSSASSTATSTPSSTSATNSASASTSDTPAPDSGSSGLSSGAIAGIAVGSIIGGIAIIGAAGLFFWRRRKSQAAAAATGSAAAAGQTDGLNDPSKPHEYYQNQNNWDGAQQPAPMYQDNQVYEIGGGHEGRIEMDGGGQPVHRAEMDGSGVTH
ncbi:hypothetical protein GQ53DRAFT_838240 [Thozetella sp. PMI_491]|nr:hypothetical protein GQ53DRAFT_838240 [Thozetella sp. PMI_491]